MYHIVQENVFSNCFITKVYSCINGNKASTKFVIYPYPLYNYFKVYLEDGNDDHDIHECINNHMVYSMFIIICICYIK